MLLFCGTRTLCSKNEETKVCVFFLCDKFWKGWKVTYTNSQRPCSDLLWRVVSQDPGRHPMSLLCFLNFPLVFHIWFGIRVPNQPLFRSQNLRYLFHLLRVTYQLFNVFFLWHSMPGFSKRSPYSQRAAASGCSTCRESAAHFGTWDAHGTTWINLKNPWRNRASTRPGYVNSLLLKMAHL